MPLIEKSTYLPPLGFKSPHIQSIFPSIFRSVKGVRYERERIDTPDNDFIDLDWCSDKKSRCVILIHGLEGHSYRSYILGMVKIFYQNGWDTVSINLRGCSGQPNRQLRSYHHGATDDLYTVIEYVLGRGYREISIVGFSLGGNMLLKYLGENLFPVPDNLVCSVAISSPCDLSACARKMDLDSSKFYRMRFLKMLYAKNILKNKIFPDKVTLIGARNIKTFREYDNRYTAPLHGFSSADDYYTRSGSLQFLKNIKSPVLMINAEDDPFLTPECNPREIAQQNPALFLEVPKHGGHLGFITFNRDNEYWHEKRTISFVEKMTR